MQKRKLGTSNIEVSVVGVGCNNFGRRIHDVADARAVVHRALDVGITLFDTADVYGYGTSEKFLGEILGPRRKDAVIATKFGLSMGSGGGGTSPRYIAQAVEASLKRLRTDYIDLYQVHFPDTRTPLEETMRALDELVQSGKVRAIGLSNHSPAKVDQSHELAKLYEFTPFVTCQDEYSLLVRGIEKDLFPVMQKHGMTLLPYAPLAGGFLSGKYERGKPLPPNARLTTGGHYGADVLTSRNWKLAEQLRGIAAKSGRSVLDLAFGWILAQPVTASVIAGASTPVQIEANARAGAAELSPEDVAALDRLTR